MMNRQIAIGLVFLAGCVAGGVSSQLVAPPARAGAPVTRWEYYCVDGGHIEETDRYVPQMNAAGAKGWELVSTTGFGNRVAICMKRALP